MKLKMLVFFGSSSTEHEISCRSAANILQNIDTSKYDVTKIGIDKNDEFYIYSGDIEKIKQNKWLKDEKNKYRITNIIDFLRNYDVAFPVLHGKYGEGGKIQKIFELANIKYIGCSSLESSVAMNKLLCKKLVSSINIDVVDYVDISKEKYENSDKKELIENIQNKLDLPLFVKPNKEGSSYGVSKVDNISKLYEAMKKAFTYDDTVLVEKYISDKKEIECGVIQKDKKIIVTTPGEIYSENEVYDYYSKYSSEKSYTKVPAIIKEETKEKIKKYSKDIFKILNLTSLARVDFFVTKEKIFFNEVNTMPGFTDISMYPKMLINDGFTYTEIIDTLVDNALNK